MNEERIPVLFEGRLYNSEDVSHVKELLNPDVTKIYPYDDYTEDEFSVDAAGRMYVSRMIFDKMKVFGNAIGALD